MRFLNGTGQAVQVRLDDGKNSYIWKIVETGEEIETSSDYEDDYIKGMGFTHVNKPVQALEGSIGKIKEETKKVDINDLKKDIDKIKGIGKKRIGQISKVIDENMGVKDG